MSDERFAEFLRRAAADYHRPPETPREEIWARVREGLAEPTEAPGDAGEADDGTDGLVAEAASLYHVPLEPPREAMWERVRSEWLDRRTAPELGAGAHAGSRSGRTAPERVGPGRPGASGPGPDSVDTERPDKVPPWAWGLAVAAALLVGVVLGRGDLVPFGPFGSGPPSVAVGDAAGAPEGSPGAAADAGVAPSGADEGGADADGTPETAGPTDPEPTRPPPAHERETGRLALETGEGLEDPAGLPAGEALAALAETEPGTGASGSGRRETRRSGAFRAAAFAHLGRSELFLTRFRSDPEALGDAPARARGLLAETRLFLDRSGPRDPHLEALLQELELVLTRIARLDEGVWPGERERIVDRLEGGGVLMLLRGALPAGGAASSAGSGT